MTEEWFVDELENELKTLKAERDALREALKPFAKEADEWPDNKDDGWRISTVSKVPLTVGDLRRARAALK